MITASGFAATAVSITRYGSLTGSSGSMPGSALRTASRPSQKTR